METVTRTNRQILDILGTITSADGLNISVRFDLIELEDLVDGLPGPKFTYGVLRFPVPLEPTIAERLLSATHPTLSGGGIESTLCLYKLNSFTLLDIVKKQSSALSLAAA